MDAYMDECFPHKPLINVYNYIKSCSQYTFKVFLKTEQNEKGKV